MFRRLLIFAFIVAGFLLPTINGQELGLHSLLDILAFKVNSNKTIRNAVDDNYPKVIVKKDVVYMDEDAADLYVGSAQVAIRVHPPPEEQAYVLFFCAVFLDMNIDYFSASTELKEIRANGNKVQAKTSEAVTHPAFGFLTLANNVAYRSVTPNGVSASFC